MNEKDMKMAMLNRAVGQIEGVAFFQSEMARNLLMGAVEDITSGVKAMQSWIMAMEEARMLETAQIGALMKDKDDLLTENGKLRAAVEERGLDTPPALRATSPIVGEGKRRIATSAAPPRNDEGGVPAGDPSGGSAATYPCAGEALGAEDGCEYCRNKKVLETDGATTFFIDRAGWLSCRVADRTKLLAELKYCPMCGRKL